MVADANTPERDKKYVLVVDAHAVDRFSTCILLQRFGYYSFTARTMKEAVKFIKVKSPSAIVVDAGLIVSSLLNTLREDKRFSKIPLIVLSSTPDAAAEERWIQEGAIAACLRKPLDVEEFYRTIQTVVEKGDRRNIRVPTHLAAMLEDRSALGEGYIEELSEDGLFFQGLESLPKNTRIAISFELKGRTILLEAVVLYNTTVHEEPFLKPGMGMRFDRISPVDRDLIKTFVLEQIKEGTPRQRYLH